MRVEMINDDYNELRILPLEQAVDEYCSQCMADLPREVLEVKHFSNYPYPIQWDFCDKDCWEFFKEKIYNGGCELEATEAAS